MPHKPRLVPLAVPKKWTAITVVLITALAALIPASGALAGHKEFVAWNQGYPTAADCDPDQHIQLRLRWLSTADDAEERFQASDKTIHLFGRQLNFGDPVHLHLDLPPALILQRQSGFSRNGSYDAVYDVAIPYPKYRINLFWTHWASQDVHDDTDEMQLTQIRCRDGEAPAAMLPVFSDPSVRH